MVPLFNRNVEFSYCDAREIPSELEAITAEFGDTVLLIRLFDPLLDRTEAFETLFLTFKLL
jgi:hypothetical protein